jgi:hypothetical protein
MARLARLSVALLWATFAVGTGPATAAPPATGAELAQLCTRDADACQSFLIRVAALYDDEKTVCLPHGMEPAHLKAAYTEWAAASDADLLAREPADQAVLSALKEMFSCDE